MNRLKNLYEQYFNYVNKELIDYKEVNGVGWPLFYPNYFKQHKKTNGLTRCIITYIRLKGWMAERITSAGRVIDNREIYTDVAGFLRQSGSVSYIPGTSTKGTADISAEIEGKAVKIEVKNKYTNDRMSKEQKNYQKAINLTGGIYYIATDIISFMDWFDENFSQNPEYQKVWDFFNSNKNIKI